MSFFDEVTMDASFDFSSFFNADGPEADAVALDMLLPDDSQAYTPVDAFSPKSTESEQSLALEPADQASPGIMHELVDIFAGDLSQPFVPDARGAADPTMTSTFGGQFAQLGQPAAFPGNGDQLGMTAEFLSLLQSATQPTAPAQGDVESNPAMSKLLSGVDWSAIPNMALTVAPAQLKTADSGVLDSFFPLPSFDAARSAAALPMKRKNSDASDDSAPDGPAKKRRGRPPNSSRDSTVKRPYTPRHSKVSLENTSSPEGDSPKLLPSGKPSTARPKSVVPEKHLKDGTASRETGMTEAQIRAYASYDDLLKDVAPEFFARAKAFGDNLEQARDKAAEAARRAREERKDKLKEAETKVEALNDQVTLMKTFLAGLLQQGRITQQEVAQMV